MIPEDYAIRLEKKLIAEFKEKFLDKLGYEPIVMTRKKVNNDYINIIPLYKLKKVFEPYLPFNELTQKKIPLESKSRKRELVELRHMYCIIARTMGYTLKSIAVSLNRDHTTVIHNIRSFNNLMEVLPNFQEQYNEIFNVLKQLTYVSSAVDDTTEV